MNSTSVETLVGSLTHSSQSSHQGNGDLVDHNHDDKKLVKTVLKSEVQMREKSEAKRAWIANAERAKSIRKGRNVGLLSESKRITSRTASLK